MTRCIPRKASPALITSGSETLKDRIYIYIYHTVSAKKGQREAFQNMLKMNCNYSPIATSTDLLYHLSKALKEASEEMPL